MQLDVLERFLAVGAHLEQVAIDQLAARPLVRGAAVEQDDGPFRRFGADGWAFADYVCQDKRLALGQSCR